MPVLWVRASRFDEINNLAQEHITCMGGGGGSQATKHHVVPPLGDVCQELSSEPAS